MLLTSPLLLLRLATRIHLSIYLLCDGLLPLDLLLFALALGAVDVALDDVEAEVIEGEAQVVEPVLGDAPDKARDVRRGTLGEVRQDKQVQ